MKEPIQLKPNDVIVWKIPIRCPPQGRIGAAQRSYSTLVVINYLQLTSEWCEIEGLTENGDLIKIILDNPPYPNFDEWNVINK